MTIDSFLSFFVVGLFVLAIMFAAGITLYIWVDTRKYLGADGLGKDGRLIYNLLGDRYPNDTTRDYVTSVTYTKLAGRIAANINKDKQRRMDWAHLNSLIKLAYVDALQPDKTVKVSVDEFQQLMIKLIHQRYQNNKNIKAQLTIKLGVLVDFLSEANFSSTHLIDVWDVIDTLDRVHRASKSKSQS